MKKLILLLAVFLTSCTTSKKFTEKTTTKDSIVYVDKLRIDTVKITENKTVTEPVYVEVEIPCDSLVYYQKIENGKSQFKISKENGKVKIMYKQDSLVDKYKSLYEKSIVKMDSIAKVKMVSETKEKKIVHQTFWQALIAKIWQILFIIVLVLWCFGITPRLIFSKFL
jgi:hypothetical protein